jgi:hypothetical protein
MDRGGPEDSNEPGLCAILRREGSVTRARGAKGQ